MQALEFIVSLVEVDQIPNEIVMSFQDISGMQLAKPPSIGVVEKYAVRIEALERGLSKLTSSVTTRRRICNYTFAGIATTHHTTQSLRQRGSTCT